jgi:hypothetical protein
LGLYRAEHRSERARPSWACTSRRSCAGMSSRGVGGARSPPRGRQVPMGCPLHIREWSSETDRGSAARGRLFPPGRMPRPRPCARLVRRIAHAPHPCHASMAGCGAGELCSLQSVLRRERAGHWTQSVVRHELPVHLDNGLTALKLRTDLCTHAAHTLPRFIRRGAVRHGELDTAVSPILFAHAKRLEMSVRF